MYVSKIINKDYFTYIDSLDEWERENFKSKSGKNLGYSAEIMARYVSRFTEYLEEHSSLMDSRIEFNLVRLFCDKHFPDFKGQFLVISPHPECGSVERWIEIFLKLFWERSS